MAAEIFTQRFPVDAADIDELGHVNNVVYLRYAQDIAIAHWRSRADETMLSGFVWVVRRHEADYRAALTLGDEVEVRTWVDDAPQGATWARFVEIRKAASDRPAVHIKSDWALLDAATRRVKRVPMEIVERFLDQNVG
jgi:acyl-CoA thioester hydrolase